MFRRFSAVLAGLVLALSGASAASAGTPATIKFFKSQFPVLGGQLSDASSEPFVVMKDGWTISTPVGIKRADANYHCCDPTFETTWHYPPAGQPGGADRVSGTGRWSQLLGTPTSPEDGFGDLQVVVHDAQGFRSVAAVVFQSVLSDSRVPSYSSGWQTSTCKCYTDGEIFFSTKPGATATYQVSGDSLVSFVSDTGPTRGVAAVTINGHTTDVNLGVGSVKVNRVVAWNSGFLDPGKSYTLTVRVVSGRVDVEGFIDQQPCCG